MDQLTRVLESWVRVSDCLTGLGRGARGKRNSARVGAGNQCKEMPSLQAELFHAHRALSLCSLPLSLPFWLPVKRSALPSRLLPNLPHPRSPCSGRAPT